MMPGTSGVELLKAIKQISPDTEVVMMTAYGTVETAVQAMREGAYDFVEKPLKRMTIVKSVRKAAERQSLVEENRSLRHEIKLLTRREIVGTSPSLRKVLDVALQAAPSSATVLVAGGERYGQGASRSLHPRAQRSLARTVRRGQLRGHPGDHPGGGAVRARARGLHGGGCASRGAVRQGSGGHLVPGRDRRVVAAGPGEAPARAARGGVRSRGRRYRQGRRTHRGRDQSRLASRR